MQASQNTPPNTDSTEVKSLSFVNITLNTKHDLDFMRHTQKTLHNVSELPKVIQKSLKVSKRIFKGAFYWFIRRQSCKVHAGHLVIEGKFANRPLTKSISHWPLTCWTATIWTCRLWRLLCSPRRRYWKCCFEIPPWWHNGRAEVIWDMMFIIIDLMTRIWVISSLKQ